MVGLPAQLGLYAGLSAARLLRDVRHARAHAAALPATQRPLPERAAAASNSSREECAPLLLGNPAEGSDLLVPLGRAQLAPDEPLLAYRLTKRLRLVRTLPVYLKFQIFEIVDFQSSRHSGFTCLGLFLIQRVNVFQVV